MDSIKWKSGLSGAIVVIVTGACRFAPTALLASANSNPPERAAESDTDGASSLLAINTVHSKLAARPLDSQTCSSFRLAGLVELSRSGLVRGEW